LEQQIDGAESEILFLLQNCCADSTRASPLATCHLSLVTSLHPIASSELKPLDWLSIQKHGAAAASRLTHKNDIASH
jgi:hypothetical protein